MVTIRRDATPTVLDVIENYLGSPPSPEALSKLSFSELQDFGEVHAEFARAQSSEQIPEGANFIGGWIGALWSDPVLRPDLSKAILYYSRLLVLDPLADFFDDRSGLPPTRPIRVSRPEDRQFNVLESGPKLWSGAGSMNSFAGDADAALARFAAIVMNLYSLEPLIRSGVVVLRSQWPTIVRESISLQTSVRHDVQSPSMQEFAREAASAEDSLQVWDNLRGGAMTLSGGPVHPKDLPWETQHIFYYLAKTLAVADAANAQYVPATERDLELLRRKTATTVRSPFPSSYLEQVTRVIVPSFEVPIREAVAMRQSADGFEEWRNRLELIRRDGESEDIDSLRERIEMELRPAIRAAKDEVRKSSLLGTFKETRNDVIFTTGIAATTAAISGGSPVVAGGAAIASGAVAWLRRAYGQRSAAASQAVMAVLVKGSAKYTKETLRE